MLKIESNRISDPKEFSSDDLVAACSARQKLTVQFSRPDAYSPALLQRLNEACRMAGGQLQVRFFGHYGTSFDAIVLQQLPQVRDLAVDCLTEIQNEEEIGELPNLTRLTLGVFELNRPDILETLKLGQLTSLILVENRKRNFDLSPLSRCESLETLSVNGHSKGIEAVAALPKLRKLMLSAFAKKNSLDFISEIAQLKELTLILGGRFDINDLSSASLEMLQVLRVRGLGDLGDLSRLPALLALRIEDQLQLAELDLRGANLERLWLFNCKNLSILSGLETQNRLWEFWASQVALDLDELRDRAWPPSATSVGLFSGSRKWNEDAKASLADRGLGEKNGIWP